MLVDVAFFGNCTCKWFLLDNWWQKEHNTDTNETLRRVSTRMQQQRSAVFCLVLLCEIDSAIKRKI